MMWAMCFRNASSGDVFFKCFHPGPNSSDARQGTTSGIVASVVFCIAVERHPCSLHLGR